MRGTRTVSLVALIIALSAITESSVLAAIVERGPYLQQVTPSSITVRWRTDNETNAVVRYGVTAGALNLSAVGNQSGTEHEVTVSGLTPGTRFYYSVGDSTETLMGGDSSFRFLTSPISGSDGNTRIWVVGDSGTADSNARAVRDAYVAYSGDRPADIWLMLGDNAYDDGTDAEYQGAVFDMYPTILRNTPLWSTLGNHDGHSADSDSEQGPYYDIFTLPRNAEAGGIASGTEAYYSFDYGNIHFVTLDSYETDRSAGGAMLTWLENDLATTSQKWLIAFWHHPPYTKGSHDSDSEGNLIDMRERALPILESYGVDLVLTGHSHSYERSFLIDGHYGLSNTFDTSSMLIDSGSGREDDTGAYGKPVVGNPNLGTVYAVAGSSGKTSSGSLNHPVMFVSLRTLGSMVLDVDGDRLDAAFIDNNGTRRDYFTIQKGVPVVDTEAPTPPSNLQVSNRAQTSLTVSWQAASDNVAVTGYRIARDGIVLTTTAALSYDDTGLAAGTQYVYTVVALDAAGNESAPVTITGSTTLAPDVDAPTPVVNLTASFITTTSVTLAWDAASDNVAVTAYRVSRDGAVISNSNALSIVDGNLTAGSTYTYAVVALDAAGNESTSVSVSATTQTGGNDGRRKSGGGAAGLIDLFALATTLMMFRLAAGRRTPPVMCLILLFGAPPLAVAHADTDEQLARVNAQLAGVPDDYHLLTKRGNLHGQHGDWELAVADLIRAQALAPEDTVGVLDLDISLALLHSDDAKPALPFIDRYLVAHPHSSTAWRVRAHIQMDLNKTDAALEDFDRAIHYAPVPTPEHYIERARVLEHEAGRFDELLAGIDDGIGVLGPLVSLLEYAIDIELQRGNYAGALKRIASLPEPIHQQSRWLHQQSRVLLELGRDAEAESMNRKALQAIESLPPARRNNVAYDSLRREIETAYAAMAERRAF